MRTALGHLKSTSEITTTAHRRFQVITIVNYDLYQSSLTGTTTGCQQAINSLSTPYQQQLKNNKELINNEEEYISASTESYKTHNSKKIKHKHGEYNNVLLTDEEFEKLKSEYPDYEERIERLSSYVASTGKSYKSHYATIRNWARKEQPGQPTREKRIKKHGGTYL